MMIPPDFADRDLIAEARMRWIGCITERAAYALAFVAIAFICAHALIGFLSWPDTTTELTALESRAVIQETSP
jgi:hypothetical protein